MQLRKVIFGQLSILFIELRSVSFLVNKLQKVEQFPFVVLEGGA